MLDLQEMGRQHIQKKSHTTATSKKQYRKGKKRRCSIDSEIDLEILKVVRSLQADPSPNKSRSSISTTENSTGHSNCGGSRLAEEGFARMVAETLESMDERSRAMAKLRIHQVLVEVQFPST